MHIICLILVNIWGTAVTQILRCCATNRKVASSIPAGVIGIFHWNKILPIALWPWGRLSLYQKWVPGAFPGGKGGRCVRLKTLQPSWTVFTKSGNLNFLEPSGPLQVCNETALPFFTHTYIQRDVFHILRAFSWNKNKRLTARMNSVESFKKFFLPVCSQLSLSTCITQNIYT